MNSVDVEVLRTAVAWLRSGHGLTLATVVRTWGSAPRPPGSLMILRDDGLVAGSVSGGCVEDDLIHRLRTGELPVAKPVVTTYGGTQEESRRFDLPCGSSLQIVLEPVTDPAGLAELLTRIEARQSVERILDLATGAVRLGSARAGDTVSFDGLTLRSVFGPGYRLLIVGATQIARYVAAMAVMVDYRVTVCEPREEYLQAWEPMEGVLLADDMPDDLVAIMNPDDHCAVIAVTHDPQIDDLALMRALKTPAFYVGALGSRRNNDRRRQRLLEFGLTAGDVVRLRGPVGLNFGALTPAEIALSIVAEMTAVRRGAELSGPLTDWSTSQRECRLTG